MKNRLKKAALVSAIGLALWAAYLVSQQPKVWCNRQWAGVALLKGGYRSWTISFCDGFLGGIETQPVVVTATGYRKGYYHWPKFDHVDVREFIPPE